MNSQANLLNPSYSLRGSSLSMGKTNEQNKLYTTSQVNALPIQPKQQYFVTSSFAPNQINNSMQAQYLAASRLDAQNQQTVLNSQMYSANLYQNIQGFK